MAARCDDWFSRYVEKHITDGGRAAVRRHREAGDLCAIVTGASPYASRPLARRLGIDHVVSTVFETEHPIVSVHPETGRRGLLLGGFAARIAGHSTAESVDIVRTLQSYVVRPENTVRWKWTEGDVIIWDNRATQHYAINDYRGAARRVQRMTTLGEPIVGVDGSTSKSVRGDATYYYSAAEAGAR